MPQRQAHRIHAGREKQRVAQRQQPGVAKGDVIAHRIDCQHHDPRQIGRMILRQHELRREQQCHHGQMQPQNLGTTRHARAPNRPCGRKTNTMATNKVAMILANVGA